MITNEEAINTLISLKQYYNDKNEDSYVGFDNEDNEALDMAIKALEQQPCEDCISREEALKHTHIEYDDDGIGHRVVYAEDIEELPSVTPQRPKGKWIPIHPLQEDDDGAYICSNCEHGDWDCDTSYKYCPFCGADMRESEE